VRRAFETRQPSASPGNPDIQVQVRALASTAPAITGKAPNVEPAPNENPDGRLTHYAIESLVKRLSHERGH
jgi:hypothetical protein